MSRMQCAAFLEWAVSKKLISKKGIKTLANQAQKEMKNLLDDKKMERASTKTFVSHLKKCTNIFLRTKTRSMSLKKQKKHPV